MSLRPAVSWPRGQVLHLHHQSRCLEGNLWGDPALRTVKVYLPPGQALDGPRLPALWSLAAFGSSGIRLDEFSGLEESLPQRLDRLIGQGRMPPCVLIAPDGYTALGGNQYLDSPAVGNYASWLHRELLPWAEQQLPVLPGARHRAVFGKSSGGYGALAAAWRWPGHWAGVASHAGDMGFEWVYPSGFPATAACLAEYGGDPMAFLRKVWRGGRLRGSGFASLNVLAMAATYDPGDAQTPIQLPFDLQTLEYLDQRWSRWLLHDPVRMDEAHLQGLADLRGLWIDVGRRDEYQLLYGNRRLVRRLQASGIAHQFAEFDGGHSGIDHRFDESLPYLASLIS